MGKPPTAAQAAYKELLDFFRPLLALRKEYVRALRSSLPPPLAPGAGTVAARVRDGVPLLDKTGLSADYPSMRQYFLDLLDLIAGKVPQVTEEIRALIDRNGAFETLVQDILQNRSPDGRHAPTLRFLLEETVNPLLAVHAEPLARLPALNEWGRGYCPACGGNPLLALLCGAEGKKFLVCSACHIRWPFSRVQCASCGTQDPKHVSLLMPEGDAGRSIEICDNCKTYLKTIDCRRVTGEIEPDLENLTTLHLDIIARSRGYTNPHLFMMDA